MYITSRHRGKIYLRPHHKLLFNNKLDDVFHHWLIQKLFFFGLTPFHKWEKELPPRLDALISLHTENSFTRASLYWWWWWSRSMLYLVQFWWLSASVRGCQGHARSHRLTETDESLPSFQTESFELRIKARYSWKPSWNFLWQNKLLQNCFVRPITSIFPVL